ncbi:hypothetical protein [uncultured Enterovirga sp.]|uniref:hypothetical protein n=1 Tax=uncultured Enterovirga sp. TaxID=2026352 RepID=UPI0035CA9571
MATGEFQRIIDTETSISGKIRALDRAGVARADIARLLNRRYQHVRNVLEGDKLRGDAVVTSGSGYNLSDPGHNAPGQVTGAPDLSPPGAGRTVERLAVNADGTLTVPAHIVSTLGARPGDGVVAVAEVGEMTVLSPAMAMSRAQQLVRELIAGEDSLAESLLTDRRREVESDIRG